MNSFTLPLSAIVKIFPSENELSKSQQNYITEKLQEFLSNWKAHGVTLAAEVLIMYNRFVIVAVNDKVELPSGCSLDSLFRYKSVLEKEMGINLSNNSNIYFENLGSVSAIPFNKVSEIQITSHTKVFNLLCLTIEDLQQRFIQLPENSSYSRLFSK